MRYLLLSFSVFTVIAVNAVSVFGKEMSSEGIHYFSSVQDSLESDTAGTDTAALRFQKPGIKVLYWKLADSIAKTTEQLALFPSVSLQQALKGKAAGLYVQEQSGEPGSYQNMFIRGTPMPLLSQKDLYQSQPLVVLDGIPLISEHPFAYDLQQYDFARLGPSTNLLTGIDVNNFASIEVLKDLAATAVYGPRAVNGAIVLTSKYPQEKRKITFDSYIGMAQRPHVNTINGVYENQFRQWFYDRYTANGRYSDDENYPVYLSDSLNNAYSGPSNWSDLYYQNTMVYSLNAGISGGSKRASFRFSLGNLKNQGVADDTEIDRYSAMFTINMKPIKWLMFSAMVNANRVERDRNRNMRDRFTQINYFPDMSAPLPPNKNLYGTYLAQFDKGYDDNKTNIIEGFGLLNIDLGRFNVSSRFAVDYNEGSRDVFYPRSLLQETSYASNYYGFNQRLLFENTASYSFDLEKKHHFFVEAGQSVQWDTYKFNNAYAYKGANDFIKLNLLDSKPKNDDGSDNGNYLNSTSFPRELTYRMLDKTQHNLVSFYGKADYNFMGRYSLSALLRTDASSNAQPTKRWFFSPVLSAAWSIKKEFLADNSHISDMNLRISVGRLGRLHAYDNYAQGPQYTATTGYSGNLTVPGYNAFGVLVRPYSFGWVGYGIPWAYSNQLNIGLDAGILDNRVQFAVDFYSKTEKNLLIGIPAFAEYGYEQSIESGMSVNNIGIDLAVNAQIISKKAFSWNSSLNFNHNSSKLKALPRGLNEVTVGNRMLKVGEPIDRYWLFENNGIYTADTDVPVKDGQPLKYNGTALKAGDPRWKDQNGDNIIDDDDKVLKGHSMPVLSGGFDNAFTYKNWSLNLNFYFNLGRDLVNQEMANRFDFINREGNSDLNSVKEITYWEKRGDYSKYPLYNPWSTVIPYRVDQDLFLEDASFLKLRTVSLGYDLTKVLSKRSIKMNSVYVYGTVSNVFTITSYSGGDPELVTYTGYDTGYGLPIPRTYSLGVKMDF